jgi:glycosyltransferase involved in cell wall biosynthesis
MEQYPFSHKPKDYLLFVGRIDLEKGVHHAMDAAVALGRPLIIAAKLDDQVPSIRNYFVRQIQPRLRRHPDLLRWVGEVDEDERNRLMKDAYCFLHPVTWPEPFGLTLIEAMACGCPVVAFNQGSIPEVVRDGETGFVVKNLKGMIEAIKCVDIIDRAACRAHALLNFSAKRMADGYEDAYRRAIAMKRSANELHTLNPARIPKGKHARDSVL